MTAARMAPRLWTMTSALGFALLLPHSALAQPAYPPPPPDQYRSSPESIGELSTRLERLAFQTRDEAKIDQRRRGSEELAERIDDFAKDAHRFRLLATENGVPASKINDEIRKLVDDARKVQNESARARVHDPQTDADWNRTVALLDRIDRGYLASNGLSGPVGTRGYGDEGGRPYRDRWGDNGTTLLNDLDRRADDAARLSESANLEITPEIERLRDQVRSFRQGSADMSLDDRRANIAEMLGEARAAQADLSGSNASPRLRDDVNGMVGTLVQMRDMNSESVGTSGYGPGPGIDNDRYLTMDPVQLTRELDSRVTTASNLAARSDLDDVGHEIDSFRDKVRDFENNSQTMSREDRRESLDNLLQDAQNAQRDLARRHASADLTNQWNDVVNLLVRLRDRQ